MSDARHVELIVRDHAAWVTICRPERRNALALATMTQLMEAFIDASANPDVRAIVLTGAGDKAFCAGADLKELDERERLGLSPTLPMTGVQRNIFELILETGKPTIAALNGAALGAGCELMLACDVRIAARHASIALPEAKRGLGANFGSVILPRMIPRALAFELLYTGNSISAERALAIGLLNRVSDSSTFKTDVEAFVAEITANAPLSLQRFKAMNVKGWEMSVHSALRLDVGPNPYLSEDRAEGVRAFLEKRLPRWTGR